MGREGVASAELDDRRADADRAFTQSRRAGLPESRQDRVDAPRRHRPGRSRMISTPTPPGPTSSFSTRTVTLTTRGCRSSKSATRSASVSTNAICSCATMIRMPSMITSYESTSRISSTEWPARRTLTSMLKRTFCGFRARAHRRRYAQAARNRARRCDRSRRRHHRDQRNTPCCQQPVVDHRHGRVLVGGAVGIERNEFANDADRCGIQAGASVAARAKRAAEAEIIGRQQEQPRHIGRPPAILRGRSSDHGPDRCRRTPARVPHPCNRAVRRRACGRYRASHPQNRSRPALREQRQPRDPQT